MERINKDLSGFKERNIKVVQYGQGNFLRGFVDYFIDVANEKNMFNGNIAIVKPRERGNLNKFIDQENQYTLLIRGIMNDNPYEEIRIIKSISSCVSPYEDYEKYIELSELESLRYVVSNTTEAGIVFDEKDTFEEKTHNTFPAKLTQFLFNRYNKFNNGHGLVILPLELIDYNGKILKSYIRKYAELWQLDKGFMEWLDNECIFVSTLVDRIVTGFPKDEYPKLVEKLGYEDLLLNTAEPFALWAIEPEKDISDEFQLDKAMQDREGVNIIFTDNLSMYKKRKVRILNGVHTSFAMLSFLAGNDYVRESLEDELICKYVYKTMFDEIIPSLDMDREGLEEYGLNVLERFKNGFIQHSLLSISLNSISKYQERCLPSILEYYEKYDEIPDHLAFSTAAMIAFYHGSEIVDGKLIAYRNGEKYEVSDTMENLLFFVDSHNLNTKDLVKAFLCEYDIEIEGFEQKITSYLNEINEFGIREAIVREEL